VEYQLPREHDLAQERVGRQDRHEMPELLEKEIRDPPARRGHSGEARHALVDVPEGQALPGGEVAPSAVALSHGRRDASRHVALFAHRDPNLIEEPVRQLAPQERAEQLAQRGRHARRHEHAGTHDHRPERARSVRLEHHGLGLDLDANRLRFVLAFGWRLLVHGAGPRAPLLHRPRVSDQDERRRARAPRFAEHRLGAADHDAPLAGAVEHHEARAPRRVNDDVAPFGEPADAPGVLEIARAELGEPRRRERGLRPVRERAHGRAQPGKGGQERAAHGARGAGQ